MAENNVTDDMLIKQLAIIDSMTPKREDLILKLLKLQEKLEYLKVLVQKYKK